MQEDLHADSSLHQQDNRHMTNEEYLSRSIQDRPPPSPRLMVRNSQTIPGSRPDSAKTLTPPRSETQGKGSPRRGDHPFDQAACLSIVRRALGTDSPSKEDSPSK